MTTDRIVAPKATSSETQEPSRMRVRDVAAELRLDTERVVPAHAAEGALGERGVGSIRSWWNALGSRPSSAWMRRERTASEDQQDDDDAAGERDLVPLEARPGDLPEGTTLDLPLARRRRARPRGCASACAPVVSIGAVIVTRTPLGRR